MTKRPRDPAHSIGPSGKHPRGELRVSWWLAHSAPDQREGFIAAAKARDAERVEKFVAGYANTDGSLDK
jgi:hypothetical protein